METKLAADLLRGALEKAHLDPADVGSQAIADDLPAAEL
jgi:hypothetical protein